MAHKTIARFHADRAKARELADTGANLCAFATVTSEGLPKVRTLVLRDLDEQLAVFINQTSPKWKEKLAAVSVCVYLDSLKLQYRLECETRQIPTPIVAASWQLRPQVPKQMDWLYAKHPQGSVIQSREQLVEEVVGIDHKNQPPDTAIGLFLNVIEIERLDLGQDNGIHERLRYRRENNWRKEILVP